MYIEEAQVIEGGAEIMGAPLGPCVPRYATYRYAHRLAQVKKNPTCSLHPGNAALAIYI